MLMVLAYAADITMILASLGAAIYCLVLSRRLSRLTSFDQGIGGAIAVLSAQVDDMQVALAQAKAGSDGAGHQLRDLVHQARDISGELELMIAACHDFAEEALTVQTGGANGSADDPGALAAPRAVARARDREDAAPLAATDAAEPDPVATPVFGSRRAPATEPVFRRQSVSGG